MSKLFRVGVEMGDPELPAVRPGADPFVPFTAPIHTSEIRSGNRPANAWTRAGSSLPSGSNTRPAGAWTRAGSPGGTFAGPTLKGADAETKLDSDVAVVIHAFRTHGTAAGLKAARLAGLDAGAKLYVEIRGETEEQLAARLASLRARLAAAPRDLGLLMRHAFVAARLAEVRVAVKAGHSAPQAVADRAEIPRTEIPRWVTLGAFAMSAIALLRSLG